MIRTVSVALFFLIFSTTVFAQGLGAGVGGRGLGFGGVFTTNGFAGGGGFGGGFVPYSGPLNKEQLNAQINMNTLPNKYLEKKAELEDLRLKYMNKRAKKTELLKGKRNDPEFRRSLVSLNKEIAGLRNAVRKGEAEFGPGACVECDLAWNRLTKEQAQKLSLSDKCKKNEIVAVQPISFGGYGLSVACLDANRRLSSAFLSYSGNESFRSEVTRDRRGQVTSIVTRAPNGTVMSRIKFNSKGSERKKYSHKGNLVSKCSYYDKGQKDLAEALPTFTRGTSSGNSAQ